MIRVVVVGDQYLVREGLRALLERADDIEVIGEAGTGRAGVEMITELRPDVTLMDIRMPDGDGLEATRRLANTPDLADVRIIVLTTFDTDENILDAVRAGAAGFVLKDTSPEQLRDAVRIVAAGDALLSPAVTQRVMAAAATSRRPLPQQRLAELTERERQVLATVGEGLSNREIAERLTMSVGTARTHVGRLFNKLGARDRAQLVIIAYETGLVTPD